MSRVRHPDKDIEAALRFAEARGWRLRAGGSHAWGADVLPLQRQQMPVRGILRREHLEHATQHLQSRQSAAPCGRELQP